MFIAYLSVQRTFIEPNVSTVARDLHRMRSFDREEAIFESESVTQTGRPSGTKATATDTTLMMSWAVEMKPG